MCVVVQWRDTTRRYRNFVISLRAYAGVVPSDEELSRRAFLLRIRFSRGKNDSVELAHLSDVLTALNHYPGDDHFELIVRNGRWQAVLRPPTGSPGVRCCPELTSRLEAILGPHTVDTLMLPAPA